MEAGGRAQTLPVAPLVLERESRKFRAGVGPQIGKNSENKEGNGER